jgi:predicted ATPase/class 3 adenylate cyclase
LTASPDVANITVMEAPAPQEHRAAASGSTLTFLFSDIEGSTRLLRALGTGYDDILRVHDHIIRSSAEAHGGSAFGSEGDAQNLVFQEAGAAVRAALAAQLALATHAWPADVSVHVRMGVHTGEARRLGDDYVGLALHETARIASAGHGGQVLVSAATAELVRDVLPEGVGLRDLGEHDLKDLARPVRIYQVTGPDIAADFPPLRTPRAVGARLPTQRTTFVPRPEVDTIARLLVDERLVTLTGPGGTGKTRISIEVAAAVAPRFADGALFVSLEALQDARLVASEIASVIGLAGGTAGPIDRLVAHLHDRSMLLVLDNFEQVIEAGEDVSRLLSDCPRLSMLVSSRIPLRLYGEHEFPVSTLPLPPAGSSDLSVVAASEAVRLFVERAMVARPDFALNESNALTVSEIVTDLDGLPLAIELAAARLRMLPVQALRERLGDRLVLLTSGARDLPERQRTLRGAISWSHELLDDPDRRLFARFSVIAGGATLEDADAVCGPASDLGRDVFDGISSLSEQSLIRVTDEGGAPRCSMLVTIREYAAERLVENGEADAIARRHAETYLALLEEAAPMLLGAEGQRWNDRIEHEHDNVRAALDWIVRSDEGELGLRTITAAWRFWQVRGHLIEGDERTHAVLALPSVAAQDAVLRTRAESAAGGISYWRSRPESTYRHYAAALEAARETGDRKILADALYDRGFAPSPDAGDQITRFRDGRPWFEESLAIYRELDDRPGIASTTWALAMSLGAHGDVEASTHLAEQSLELSRELGDPFRIGWAAHLVGLARLHGDRLDESAADFAEALDIFRQSGDETGIILLLVDVAGLADRRGDRELRWCLVGAALHMRDDSGVNLIDEITAGSGSLLGWDLTFDPGTDEEAAWLERGRTMPLETAIQMAADYTKPD